MDSQTTAFFESDGINTIALGKSGSGETVTIDRANGIGTVSYTHLTLPTKRIV